MFRKSTTTVHANDRVNNRLGGLVTKDDMAMIESMAKVYKDYDKVYYQVKKFSKVKNINEGGYSINGDAIVAVFKNGRVVTVMLAKSWRKEYFSDGYYVG